MDPGPHLSREATARAGTLALLTAECSNRFRGVFAFGAVASPVGYGAGDLTFDTSATRRKKTLRGAYRYINTISTPTFLFEGTEAAVQS